MPVDIAHIEFFVLIFIRLVSAFAVLPIFRNAAFPTMTKAGLAGLMALLLMPTLQAQMPPPSGTVLDFVNLGVRETACGILLGFAGQTLFFAVEICGQLLGFQAGFSMVSAIDPNTETESTVLTQIYNLMAMMVFLSIDGHHMLLKALSQSLHTIPVGGLMVDGRLSQWGITTISTILADGIRMAAPLMMTLLLTDIGLGILTRVAPTLNVFVLGFPLKIGITLVVVSMTMGVVASIFTSRYAEFAQGYSVFQKMLSTP
jgi:flagellar biosynthesis protein FliR